RQLLLLHLWWSSCSSERDKAGREPNPQPFPSGKPKEPSWEQDWEEGLDQQGPMGRIPPGGAWQQSCCSTLSRVTCATCGSHLCCAGRGAVLSSAAQYLGFSIQFKKSPPKIPYKAIALAVVLFMIGTFLIIIGALLLAGYISKGETDRAIPVLIIGILVFLPGFYHLRIAYYASKGYRGYSYDDIPDFDD
ncbi:hypothetical protein Nmel_018558, partial [Mimus melanotis]